MSTRNDARAQFEAWAKEQHLIGASGYSPSGKIAWQAWQAARQPVGVEPFELRICEVRHTVLKPNKPYIFTIDPNCKACLAQAAYAIGETSAAPPAPAAVPEGMILVDKEDLTDVCLDLLNLVDVTQFSKTRAERDKSVAHKLLELLTNE